MGLMFWKTKGPELTQSLQDLFGDGQCFVDGHPSKSGFGEIYLPDRFRGMGTKASCIAKAGFSEALHPYLLVRATPNGNGPHVRLSVELNGFDLGAQAIPHYGTYYFAIPLEAIKHPTSDRSVIRFEVLGANDGESAIALYEARLIDAACDDFPDRHAFADKLSLFSPAGGIFYETLSNFSFKPGHRLLEVGAGEGHLACLVSAFSGACVMGIDVIDYDSGGKSATAQKLAAQFRLHRSLLGHHGLQELGSDEGIAAVMGRTRHVTMDAEQMSFPEGSFDFVYSLNVMEHIPHPEQAISEIRRVLRPGGVALFQFSPLYYSDSGSHLPGTLGFNQPWAQLVMSRDEIKQAIVKSGGVPNEVDHILDSLNGHPPQLYRDAVERSGMEVMLHHFMQGFTVPGAEESLEYQRLLAQYSEDELTTYGMCWVLKKPQ